MATTRRRPPRAAAPTNVLRAASVNPVLPPMAPGYRVRSSSWLAIGWSPLSPGNIADGSAVIWANTGLAIAARKMTARSWAVDQPEPPGPSKPDGVDAWGFTAPR